MKKLWEVCAPELIKHQILRPGGAFRKWHEFDDEGAKNRFFFILNLTPDTDQLLLVTTATTQIAQRARAHAKMGVSNLLISLQKSEYPDLNQDSVVDCSKVEIFKLSDIVDKIEAQELMPLPALPDEIVQKMREAVRASPFIREPIKRIIAPDFDIPF